MRAIRILAVLAMMGAMAVGSAKAAPPAPDTSVLSQILARGTLRVGMTGDYRPFDILDAKTGQFSGIDVVMANRLARALGVKLDIVKTTWPTLMQGLLTHKYDIAMGGITITLPRLKTAFFSTPVMRAGKIPFTLCKNVNKYQTIAEIDRPDVKVIVNPGGTNAAFDKAHLPHAQIVVIKDNTKTFGEILDGKVDLMITDNVEARLQHTLHPALCPVHPDQPFTFSQLGYMMPQDPALQSFVDYWLRIERHDGTYKHLLKASLDATSSQPG
ncbi:MAG TPA: transporter substrate-binding domain-containing protein [Acidiphilium sp.]